MESIDMVKELSSIKDKMRNYNFMLGQSTHFKLLNPKNAIKKSEHKGTVYYYFKAEIISKDHEIIPFGKHTIQLPSKRVVFPLINKLKEMKRLNKSCLLTITKGNGNTFDIKYH